MLRLSDELEAMVAHHAFLRFGLSRGLLNLARTADYLRPHLETALKKPLSASSVHMALVRLARGASDDAPVPEDFHTEHIQVRSDLSIATFAKTPAASASMTRFYARVSDAGGYCTLSEGTAEITSVFETRYLAALRELSGEPPLSYRDAMSGIGVRFSAEYVERPGFLSALLEQLLVRRINVLEIASTRTETIFYVAESDAKNAFETLFERFCRKKSRAA